MQASTCPSALSFANVREEPAQRGSVFLSLTKESLSLVPLYWRGSAPK